MRKSMVTLLLALSLLLVICAGCGSDNTTLAEVSATMAPTATPAPTEEPVEATEEPAATEEPEETAEPEDEAEEEQEAEAAQQSTTTTTTNTTTATTNTTTTNSNSNGNTTTNVTEPEPTAVQDNRSVAESMVGQSVDALYAAIGYPNGSDYTASCLTNDGEDGMLYYGDFTVGTVRYSNGTEIVLGLY